MYQQQMPVPMAQPQLSAPLIVELDPAIYQFNKSKITSLYFGYAEPQVSAMIDEINVYTTAIASQMKSTMLCTFACFFCCPCVVCYTMFKINELQVQFNSKIQEILNKNKASLEAAGFSCALSVTQLVSHQHQGRKQTHVRNAYHLEFQKYSIQNNYPNMNMGMDGGAGMGYPPQQNYQNYQPTYN